MTKSNGDAGLGENLLLKCCCVYLDDVIVHSQSPKEHAEHLRKVLERLEAYGLLLKSPKCFFAKDSVEYLGHIISSEGIHMVPDKVKSVQEWPVPESVTDVRQYLGLAGFYRKFIKSYAKITAPMTDLTQKDKYDEKSGTLKEWPEAAQQAFEQLKVAMCEAPVLQIPEPAKGKFHVMCDASTYGLGATLFQEGADGKLHP